MQNFNKWKKSEDYRALLAEERARADRDYIAKILAKKNMQARAFGGQEPADSAALPKPQRS